MIGSKRYQDLDDFSAVRIYVFSQVYKVSFQGDIGNTNTPHVIGTLDFLPLPQMRIDISSKGGFNSLSGSSNFFFTLGSLKIKLLSPLGIWATGCCPIDGA